MTEIRLPELGENIEAVEVATVLVAVGDRVRRDQPVIEVETEKASLEVPATADGRVAELLVKAGDRIRVGQVIARLDEAIEAAVEAAPPPAEIERAEPSAPVVAFAAPPRREIGRTVPAAPSVRALARELGIDLGEVEGSGPGGRISRDDVKAWAKRRIAATAAGAPAGPASAPAALPDFTSFGPVETEPLSAVRRATARNMALSWTTVPHVTQFDRADVTQLESMRRGLNQREEPAARKLSLTAIVVKMAASALGRFPRFNASLDLERDRVVLKRYIHVGVAVDTERGLIVPVVRDADRKPLVEIAAEIDTLAARARDRKLGPEALTGASFTVSNLGGLGTTWFSPIVPWPQVAILGVGRAEQQAVWNEGQFQPRLLLPLSLSYDHRLIDGADAARFLRFVAEALEQPLLLLLDR